MWIQLWNWLVAHTETPPKAVGVFVSMCTIGASLSPGHPESTSSAGCSRGVRLGHFARLAHLRELAEMMPGAVPHWAAVRAVPNHDGRIVSDARSTPSIRRKRHFDLEGREPSSCQYATAPTRPTSPGLREVVLDAINGLPRHPAASAMAVRLASRPFERLSAALGR
jgi:hypothetical protein